MMNRTVRHLILLLILISTGKPVLADSPLYTGLLIDSAPAIAYNSRDSEFLVVWNSFNPLFPPTDKRFYGPLMGQLLKESGAKIGAPFEIIRSGGVQADVSYNADSNEYLVVAEKEFNTVGQRVSRLGLIIGGETRLLTNARYPRVLFNSLTGDYLVAGAWLAETAPGSGQCRIRIQTLQVDGNGQPAGTLFTPVDQFYTPAAAPKSPCMPSTTPLSPPPATRRASICWRSGIRAT